MTANNPRYGPAYLIANLPQLSNLENIIANNILRLERPVQKKTFFAFSYNNTLTPYVPKINNVKSKFPVRMDVPSSICTLL